MHTALEPTEETGGWQCGRVIGEVPLKGLIKSETLPDFIRLSIPLEYDLATKATKIATQLGYTSRSPVFVNSLSSPNQSGVKQSPG